MSGQLPSFFVSHFRLFICSFSSVDIKRSLPRALILAPPPTIDIPDPKALLFRPQSSSSAQSHLIAIEYLPFSELGDSLDDCTDWGRPVVGLIGIIEGGGATNDGQGPTREIETFLVFATGSVDVGCLTQGSRYENTIIAAPGDRFDRKTLRIELI